MWNILKVSNEDIRTMSDSRNQKAYEWHDESFFHYSAATSWKYTATQEKIILTTTSLGAF